MSGRGGRNIRTVGDLNLLDGGGTRRRDLTTTTGNGGNGNKSNNNNNNKLIIQHIPNLFESNRTKDMLQRVYNEFVPIIEKRGYNVKSVTEMCCCGDGCDYDSSGIRKKGRKKRNMGAGVLGYNQSNGYGSCTIHLRMRQSKNHDVLYTYEEIAGTMCHELAHCVHGNHSAKFYKLMDEIQEQHAVFQVKGIVADTSGFPMNSSESYTLGTTKSNHHNKNNNNSTNNNNNTKRLGLEAALERQRKSKFMPIGPQRLGSGSDNYSKFKRRFLKPGEAAAAAAEERRLRDDMWCQPCNEDTYDGDNNGDDDDSFIEIITPTRDVTPEKIAEDIRDNKKRKSKSSNKNNSNSTTPEYNDNDRKLPVVNTKKKQSSISKGDTNRSGNKEMIDLTCDDDDDDDDNDNDNDDITSQSNNNSNNNKENIMNNNDDGYWSCFKCTYGNKHPALVCFMCHAEIIVSSSKQQQAKQDDEQEEQNRSIISKIIRDDTIQHVKDNEVELSKETFNGFNIYGNTKPIQTSTMKHLT